MIGNKTTLSLGPKFAVQPTFRDLPTLHLLADMEICISVNQEITNKEVTRARCTNILTKRKN